MSSNTSNTCRRCSAVIPSGRNYCTAHYQEEVLKYEKALEAYHANYQQYLIDVDNWNNMSVEARNLHHKAAEDLSLIIISGLTALVIGGGIWFMFKDQWEWWIPAGITAALFMLFIFIKDFIGRLIRGLFYGIIWGVGLMAALGGLTWLLASVLEIRFVIDLTNQQSVVVTSLAVMFVLGVIIGMIKEIKGDHHVYGGPVEPSRPTAPSA